MNEKVVCVILNYNDAQTTISLVEHIQYFDCLAHIVVVDNKSTDESYEKLKQYGSSKITILQSQKNGGYGYGNNVGIQYAKQKLNADYVLVANPDVIFENNFICTLLETFKQHPNAAVVSAPQSNSTDKAWKNVGVLKTVLATSLFFEIWLKIRCYPASYFKNKKEVQVFAVPGSLLLVDVEKMMSVGGYDEDFFLYYEEPILGEKFASKGYETWLNLKTNYIHNHHVSIRKTYKRWSEQHKILLNSLEQFLKKYKNVGKMKICFSKIWFSYTRFEFYLYDLVQSIRTKW